MVIPKPGMQPRAGTYAFHARPLLPSRKHVGFVCICELTIWGADFVPPVELDEVYAHFQEQDVVGQLRRRRWQRGRGVGADPSPRRIRQAMSRHGQLAAGRAAGARGARCCRPNRRGSSGWRPWGSGRTRPAFRAFRAGRRRPTTSNPAAASSRWHKKCRRPHGRGQTRRNCRVVYVLAGAVAS